MLNLIASSDSASREYSKMQMIFYAIASLSRLYLIVYNEDSEEWNTHIRRMFCTILFIFVNVCLCLAGKFPYCYFIFSLLVSR